MTRLHHLEIGMLLVRNIANTLYHYLYIYWSCSFYLFKFDIVVHNRSIYIFGGYDGFNRVNDFYEYNIDNNTW